MDCVREGGQYSIAIQYQFFVKWVKQGSRMLWLEECRMSSVITLMLTNNYRVRSQRIQGLSSCDAHTPLVQD